MTAYAWRGRNSRGEQVSGRMDGDTREAVANQLINSGITPIEIDQSTLGNTGAPGAAWRQLFAGSRPAASDLIFFARQIYTLVKAGVPLTRGLTGVAQSTRNPALKRAVFELIADIESGRELGEAMARHPNVFSSMFVNMVRVGESSGSLEQAFLLMSGYLERDREIRARIKAALRYPAMVIIAMVIAVAILMVFVIPVFATFFANNDAPLPLPTIIIIGVSNFTADWWMVIGAALIAAILGFRYWTRTERGRYRWDRMKFRFPGIGDILFRATMARFARSFSMTYRAGVPLIQGLTLVSRAVENEYVGQAIGDMRTGIERGESLLRTAEATGLFAPLVLQMIGVGEETGEVDAVLDETADYYEREVDYDIENLSAYIEPLLLLFMAVLVLILALGVFLPMWDVGRAALG
ncbi:MAG: type II secretion system F family protein [Wenzhouxiangellaceae bacterium]